MTSLERELAAIAERAVDSAERCADVFIGDQALERVADHGGEFEFRQPGSGRRGGLHPLDVIAAPGSGKREAIGVEARKTSGMTVFPRAVEHQAGAAANVEHRTSRHHK